MRGAVSLPYLRLVKRLLKEGPPSGEWRAGKCFGLSGVVGIDHTTPDRRILRPRIP